jgi:uncharacterized protein (TIGR02391 family)
VIPLDDIEILRVIDDAEQRRDPGPIMNGTAIMQTVAARHGVAPAAADHRPFARELDNLREAGWLRFAIPGLSGNVAGPDPNRNATDYLQRIWQFEMTPAGRDRARGRVVIRPLPDPDEDDGRMIRGSTLEDIAREIGDAYTGTQLERFLEESGMPPERVPPFEGGTKWLFVHDVLLSLAEAGSGPRRELRQFLGPWLDDRLHSGPSPELRDRIVRDLGRQGWFVRDGRLVIGEPVHPSLPAGVAVARPARLGALHPQIAEVSRPLFEDGHREAAIFQAFTAVNNRVKEMSGRGDLDGVDLMAQVLKPEAPVIVLADVSEETGRNIQMGYHRIFMGVMAALRNPSAHELFGDIDEDEALEQLGLASLLMRRLDEASVPDRAS